MAKRSAIIFRHGNTVPVAVDTGIPLISDGSKEVILTQNDDLENNGNSSQFGHIGGEIREGKKLYSKDTLKKLGAHRYVFSTTSSAFTLLSHKTDTVISPSLHIGMTREL